VDGNGALAGHGWAAVAGVAITSIDAKACPAWARSALRNLDDLKMVAAGHLCAGARLILVFRRSKVQKPRLALRQHRKACGTDLIPRGVGRFERERKLPGRDVMAEGRKILRGFAAACHDPVVDRRPCRNVRQIESSWLPGLATGWWSTGRPRER